MAQSGPLDAIDQCPLLGVKPTSHKPSRIHSVHRLFLFPKQSTRFGSPNTNTTLLAAQIEGVDGGVTHLNSSFHLRRKQ
jgi:hypothetical protein